MDFEKLPVITLNTVIVGAGAAGLNTADRLAGLGQTDIAVVCESLDASTSRNTGSDKQTYYKLSLSGEEEDSVRRLAKTLFDGGCVDGDIALCEAALSAQCFLRLAELGVPFPVNRWGEYVGYKTDHDPMRRATSAGPLTSRLMVECLLGSVRRRNIRIYEGLLAISIITGKGACCGILCLDLNSKEEERYLLFYCRNVVWATGGPAGMYAHSVYPECQKGASGIAFEAGAVGKNLTEWQFGLASLHPRWNVSGSYMQVLPRIYSTENGGGGEKEFLREYYTDSAKGMNDVFFKGYQWPFDVRKRNGSSMLDILVHRETMERGRRVYLDFTKDPEGLNFEALSPEARDYLKKADAIGGTPAWRLCALNRPACEFFLSKGIDLKKQPIEIAVCAQHNNGGISADCWWQTDIAGFFAVGEACGSHGVYRPGGSALNAGQVGSMRAAMYIAQNRTGRPENTDLFLETARRQAGGLIRLAREALGTEYNLPALWTEAGMRMSIAGGPIRCAETLGRAVAEAKQQMDAFGRIAKINTVGQLKSYFELRDTLIAQFVTLSAMLDYAENEGKSRGSALYVNEMNPDIDQSGMPLLSTEETGAGSPIQEVRLLNGVCVCSRRPAREIPDDDDFFESVWKGYRENKNIY